MFNFEVLKKVDVLKLQILIKFVYNYYAFEKSKVGKNDNSSVKSIKLGSHKSVF